MSTERNRFKNWVKEIPLTKGMVALVDQSDYEILNQWKWSAQKSRTTYYAARSITINGKRVTIMMHRAILTAPAGKLIDHINHNGLDNRKSNLRIATPTQNKQNKNIQFNNTSGFKGVSFYDGRWCANVSVNSKQRLISKHYSPEEAARAYDAKAIEMQGEFACTNVKLGLLPPVKYPPIQALGSSQQVENGDRELLKELVELKEEITFGIKEVYNAETQLQIKQLFQKAQAAINGAEV